MTDPLPPLELALGTGYATAVTQLLYFVVAFLAVIAIGRAAVIPLISRAFESRGLDAHARKPLLKLVSISVLFVAIAIAFGFAGFGNFLSALATVAAAATLAIGFAMQDVIKNFVAGIFIFTDRPFKIGDWIEWDDHSGIVEDISLRVSRIRTFDNELLTVPNSDLTTGVIKNPVAKNQLRLKFLFGIGYEDDIDRAMEIILDEAANHTDILDDPEPSVRLTELDDSAIGLQARIWIQNPSRSDFVKTRGEYVQRVKERFDEAGIEIPYPQRDLSGQIALDGELPAADPPDSPED